MKNRFNKIILFKAFFLFLVLSSNAVYATEIRDRLGSFLGNLELKDIDYDDARISTSEIRQGGATRIRSGIVGNMTYREYWSFERGFIQLNALTSHYLYQETSVEKQIEFFIKNFKTQFDYESHKKLNREILLINSTHSSKVKCTFLKAFFGNYEVGFIGDSALDIMLCNEDVSHGYKESDAKALYLLSSLKVGGNIAIRGYKFPTRQEAIEAGYRLHLEKSDGAVERTKLDLSKLSDRVLCLRATRGPMENGKRSWEPLPDWADHVAEAKRRGLDCDVRSEVATNKNAQTAATRSANNQSLTSLPIAFQWSGVSDLSIGKLQIGSMDQKEGSLEATLGSGVGSCSGKWQLRGTNYGTWFVGCDGGISASGSYKMTGANSGTGEGIDSKGRAIKIKIGFN